MTVGLKPDIIVYKILKQLSTLITTAFAIAAGYEWRIAIGKILKENIEVKDDDIYTYPILVTIIAVCATIAIETLSLQFLSSSIMKKAQESESEYYKGTMIRKVEDIEDSDTSKIVMKEE